MKHEFLLRSMMFVPGHNERLLKSAERSDADALILDLEDSVQPNDQKQVAREMIAASVRDGLFERHAIFPRLNDRESGELLKDVRALAIDGVDGFVYPKARTGQDVYSFDKLLEATEAERGFPNGTFKIVPLIETTAAVLNAQEIIQASDRVIAIAFGCEDFVGDLGGIHDPDGRSIFTPRALVAMAAKANEVQAIDTVHIRVHDLEDLEKNLRLAQILGFDGMLVLHPKELPLVHEYFSPSEEQVAEAREMLRLFDVAVESKKGVAVLNGKFIGPPMVLAAKQVLALHAAIVDAGE
ncbi:MAG: CoA ester lyase [Actinomycetota bacterium]|nr:CoA ester lyase [Actinomycetota bacterium]